MLTVYSKTNCPACLQAKALLSKYGIPFEEVNLSLNEEARQFIISEGHKVVPQIYNGKDVFVEGGYLGLKEMSEEEIKRILYGEQE